jgi:hypothetical protein
MNKKIAAVLAEVNTYLVENTKIRPKAEHSLGILTPWYHHNQLELYTQQIKNDNCFYHPSFFIYLNLLSCFQKEKKINPNPEKPLKDLSKDMKEILLEEMFLRYLEGQFPE